MEIPINQIGIVADKTKFPYSSVAIDKSNDATDPWKDGFLRRSYLGLQIINEREEVPAGFATLETTLDSNEKAMKKKVLCVKFVPKNVAKTFITEIAIFSRQKRPSVGFTIVSELNNLIIAFKTATPAVSYLPANSTPAVANNFGFTPKQDEYSKGTLGRTVTPLSGVPFILSKKFANQTNKCVQSYNTVDYKNASQIDKQYTYNFSVENSVLRDH